MISKIFAKNLSVRKYMYCYCLTEKRHKQRKIYKGGKKHTDLLISVISGETEASLIYEGVSNNIKKIKNFVIVDIG